MATSQPGLEDPRQNVQDHTPAAAFSKLSLSSATIHADDYLNKDSRDVAPPLHVSTTFRYNKDPDTLKTLTKVDVNFLLP